MKKHIAAAIMAAIPLTVHASDWGMVRQAPPAAGGTWQEVPCEPGTGWRLCQPPLDLALSASPASIIGNGISTSTLTATVRDTLGNLVGAGVQVSWTTSQGTLSSASTTTDAGGKASVTLTSAKALTNATVQAVAQTDEGGSRSVTVTFVDNWLPYSSIYGAWMNSGDLYGCTWTPAPSTVASGTSFTQNGSNCQQNQTRTVDYRQISEVTSSIRITGSGSESRTLNGLTSTQTATGTYVPPAPAYTGYHPLVCMPVNPGMHYGQMNIFFSYNGASINFARLYGECGSGLMLDSLVGESFTYDGQNPALPKGSQVIIRKDGSGRPYAQVKLN